MIYSGWVNSNRSSTNLPPVRVAVLDKSPLIQAALKQILREDERLNLVRIASNVEDFLHNLEANPVDVVVTGWVIGPGDGRIILDRLRGQENAARVVVYTGSESEAVPAQVMAHGGAAFVSKSEQPEVLLNTMAAVAEGRMVFPYLDVRQIHHNPLLTLTRRELEVLADIAAGRTNKQIAREQDVSLNTIKFHVRNLFQKLDVNSRSQAIALYLKS